jgi:hypothetical protein
VLAKVLHSEWMHGKVPVHQAGAIVCALYRCDVLPLIVSEMTNSTV